MARKKQVTNQHLSMIAVIAVIVSVAGTLSLLSVFTLGGPAAITGAAVAYGNATALISQSLVITTTDNNITFPTGYVNGDNASAWMDTDGNVSGWSDMTGFDDSFEVRNDGNVDINLTVAFTGNQSWICEDEQSGTDCGVTASPNLTFKSEVQDDSKGEASSCASGMQAEYLMVNYSNHEYGICAQLYPDGNRDEMIMQLNVTIPDDAQGEKTLNLTFTSYAV